MKKVNVMLVFIAALLLSCTTAFADGGVVHVLLNTDTEYNRVLSSVSQVSPSNLGDFALELYYDEGNCFSGPTNTDYPIDVRGVEVRLYSDKYVLEVVDQYGDRHFVGYYVGDNFHIYWADSHPGDVFIDEDASFSEQIARTLEGIARQVSRIDQALTSEDGPFALWMSLLDTDLNLVNINLEQISLKVQSVVDYTNVIANGTVTLVEKMDELIEAVNGISISADGATINFDTLPITNKLDEVITAINGISVNVEGGTFDTLPITNKLDDVITAINGISVNVEGGTFDTLPIIDKLDEVIDAINGISVTGGSSCVHSYTPNDTIPATCTRDGLGIYQCVYCHEIVLMPIPKLNHRWVTTEGDYLESALMDGRDVSDQYTVRTILPVRTCEPGVSGWAELENFPLVRDTWYEVLFNGKAYILQPWQIDGQFDFPDRHLGLGNKNYQDSLSQEIVETTYPFTLTFHNSGVDFAQVKPLEEGPFTFSIGIIEPIPYCSICGENKDVMSLVGTIEHAAAVLQSAILSANSGPVVSGDYSDLIASLEAIDATLTDNHEDLSAGLGSFFEWVTTESLIAPCEHSYMPVVMMEPSCDFPGVTKFTCEYCGTFRMELSAPLGHEWEGDDSAPVLLLDNVSLSLLDSNVVDGVNVNMFGCQEIISLTPGEQYTVVYNGVSYVFDCRLVEMDGQSAPVLGNAEFMMGTGDTGDPFILTSGDPFGATVLFSLDGAASATISVYEGVVDASSGHSLRVCTRCHVGVNAAALMEFLDERLTSSPGGGSDLTPVLTRMDTIIESLGADLGAAGCEHVYVAEVNQEQTCVLPGLQTHTCELCGSSYSEILESLGHDWQCTEHVEDELDPETGEVISSGYDIYTCSICDDTYNDYDGNGAPEDGSTSITGIVSRVFEKIGSLVGELLAMSVRLLDKLLTGFDEIVTSFNEKTQQIVSFGSGYTAWLSGFWGIVPSDLQLALSFCVVVICLGIIGKKVVFAS